MKKIVSLFVVCIFVVSCAPSPEAIQKAIEQTQAANTATPTAIPEPTPTTTPETGNWQNNSKQSDFTDTQTVTILLDADSPVTGWLDTQTPTLVIRCKENEFEIYIVVGMQFDVETGLSDESTIRFRFDKGTAFEMVAGQSTDGEAVFINNPRVFLSKMVNANTLVFGFTPFNASPVSTTFDLTGLSNAVKPVLEACP